MDTDFLGGEEGGRRRCGLVGDKRSFVAKSGMVCADEYSVDMAIRKDILNALVCCG
jgi:hypothetical protein